VVACGDHEDLLSFLRLLPPRGEAIGTETIKDNGAEAEPLHERDI